LEKSEERKSGSSYIANKKSTLRTVGEFLREARQGRNLSVEDLSSSLRIGKEQLIALESGDESALPEKVFIRAMVRRIAEKLNLDTSFILEELNENKDNEPKPSPVIKKKNTIENKKLNPFNDKPIHTIYTESNGTNSWIGIDDGILKVYTNEFEKVISNIKYKSIKIK